MKKFVTFLMVGYCMLICGNDLFSSVYSNNPDKFVLVDNSTCMAANETDMATDCGTVSGFAFFASDGISPVNGQGCVDIVAQNFNDILLFQWTMEFNSTVATFSHVNIVNLPDTIFSSQPSGPDLITVSWQSANFSGINVPDCEVLFQVCFDAVGQNGAQTPLTFSGASTNIEVRDEAGTLLDPDFYPGTLTIDTNAKPPFSLQIQGGQLEENQSSCLAVDANGLNSVTDLTISHTWDPSVLQLDQVSGFNLPGLDASDFTINASAGTAVLNWTSSSSAGVTVADGTNIYDLCFTAIGSPGTSSAVSITDTPSPSSATDASGDNLTFNLSSTNVSVTSPPGACGSINGFSFYASTEVEPTNGYACVSVSAQDFEDVLTFQWTMFYDSTIIELDSAYAVSLPSGSFVWGRNTNSPNIGVPGPSQIPSNVQYPAGTNKLITVSWLEPSFGGFTLNPDCLTLFNLCFDVVGNDGQTSPVVFSSSPTNVEVADSDSNILLNNDGPFEDGSVRIEDAPAVSNLSVNIGSTTIEEGSTACIPVTVNGFTDITQFQGSLNWDASSLTFVEVRGFNLAGMDANDFTTNSAAGNLSLNWTSPSGGVTLPNGSTIYEVCFQAIGSAGTSSTVSISDTPVTNSATNTNGPVPNIIPGSTSISIATPPGACGSINGLSFYSSTECAEPGDNVCVGISAAEFTNVMTFQWSMAYDSTILELDSVYAVALPAALIWGPNTNSPNIGLPGPSNLPSNFQYPTGTNKVITVSWLEPSFSGVTLTPDCQVLFNLCFNAIGAGGQSSPIIFLDRPANVEVADPNSNILLNNDDSFEGSRVDIKTSCSGTPPPAPDVPLPSRVDIVNVNCSGASTGSIDLTFDQSTTGLTFMWTPGNVSTMDLNNVGAGTYSLNISNGSKDTTLNYTVNEPQNALDGSIGDVIQIKCNGSSDGAISIVASGGTPGYSYNWNPALPSAAVQNNLAAGNYTVTVMDANGCTDIVGPITITEPTPVQISETVTDVNCAGRSNGSISLSPNGGTPGLGYLYNWNPSLPPTATQNNLSAGSYAVTVSDSNGCTATGNYTVGSTAPLNITLGSNGIGGEANGSDGSIDIEVTGGITAGLPNGYIYVWTPTGQSTQDASNLAAGQHTVSVTDAVGCTATATFTVDFVGPAYMTGAINVSDACVNSSNGSITVNFTGGVNPQILWVNLSGGAAPTSPTSFSITGLEPGLYGYTITDQGVQVDSGSELVSIHTPLSITANISNEINGNDGSINLNPLNGVGPYTFEWSNINGTRLGGNEPFLNGLQAGTYMVNVIDNGTGCSNSATFTVEDQRPVSIGQLDVKDSDCPGASSGSVCFEVTNGVPNFTILLTGGPTGFVPRNETRTTPATFTFCEENLPPGTYTITVTDANTSVISRTFTINEPAPFSVIPAITPATDTDNGSISLTISGGTPPYNENWGGNNPNDLPAGNYSATVTDGNGCTFTTASYSVTRFRIIDVDIVDASCVDASNGSIEIVVDGGGQSYTYIWENAAGDDISTASSVTNLMPGTYTVYVTDVNSSIRISETYTVGEQSTITSTGTLTTNFGGFNVSCNGGSDGRARVNPADGQAPYTYAWNDGQSTQEALDLPAGVSTVTVTDNVGCKSITEVTLSQPSAISINEQIIGVKCFGETNGEIQLFLNGGVRYQSAEGYIFMWDEPSFAPGPTIRNIGTGVYPVTVEDANGCQVTSDVVVTGPTGPLVAQVETTPADDNCNGTTRIEVVGGTQPYFYKWFNREEADSTDRELFGLCSGTYFVEITDANGCTVTASGNVDNTSIECLTTRAVITPDGGGLNEEFIIWCIEQYPDNTLEIYNRWGQLVWEQDDYDNTWTGLTMRGGQVPDGAYFYVFRYTINGEVKQTKGSFTLLRE